MKLKIAVGAALAVFAVIITSIFIANLANKQTSPSSSSGQPSGSGSQASALTVEEVAKHSTRGDCWIIVAGDVYNVTSFIAAHPGGADILAGQCGKDATTAFETQGGTGGSHSASARSQLQSLKIGSIGSPASTPSPSPTPASPGSPTSSSGALPSIVLARYPGATLSSSEQEDGGQKYTIATGGQCREIRIKDGVIERDREC